MANDKNLEDLLFRSLDIAPANTGERTLHLENEMPVEATLDASGQADGGALFGRIKNLLGKRKLIKVLKGLDFFKGLTAEAIVSLTEVIEEHHFAKDSKIITKGKLGKRMYILSEGTVSIPIVQKGSGQRYTLQLGPGEIFGEMALLTGEPRRADVFAHTDCSVFALKRNDLEDLMYESPELSSVMTSLLGQRLVAAKEIEQVGQYKLLEPIGRGGMSIVYGGVDTERSSLVAIKMLSHELVMRGQFAEQFRTESEILAGLRHPHIVDFIDAKEAYRTFFIIMEQLSGDDLNNRIASQGRISPDETRELLRHIASALDYAHQNGIVHRDLKPSNIMFDKHGNAKLADFGLAMHAETQASLTKRGIEGTPFYMAPEQITHDPLDGRTDIYALGIVAYKMLTGTPPFQGNVQRVLQQHLYNQVPSLKETLPHIPEDLEEFVQKATAKEPQERFQSAREVLEYFGIKDQYTELSEFKERRIKMLYAPRQEALLDELIEELKEKIKHNMEIIIY